MMQDCDCHEGADVLINPVSPALPSGRCVWPQVCLFYRWLEVNINRSGPHRVSPYNQSRWIRVPTTACRPTRNHYKHTRSTHNYTHSPSGPFTGGT